MLDTKYRPRNLNEYIGNSSAVSIVKGLLDSDKMQKAILITGPTSVGKTTLGRIIATELNGLDSHGVPNDFVEIDGPASRQKEELLKIINMARFHPVVGKKRIILIDEFQHVMDNSQAVPVLLKELEEPAPNTLWILCSMDPTKFYTTKNGRAILNRCINIDLKPHTDQDLYKQGVRIIKGEGIRTIGKEALIQIIKHSRGEMRSLAHNIAKVRAYANDGGKVDPSSIQSILFEDGHDSLGSAVDFMVHMYSGRFTECQKIILDTDDHFQLVTNCTWLAKFMLNVAVMGGAKHRKIWWTDANKELHQKTKNLNLTIDDLAAALTLLTTVRMQVTTGQIEDLLTIALYRYMKGES